MRNILSVGLLGRLLLILTLVMATEFAANTWLFQRTSAFALRHEDAKRMAEHLIVARRILERTPPTQRDTVARELSTADFAIHWTRGRAQPHTRYDLSTLRSQIVGLEPELLESGLHLQLQPLRIGGDLEGSIQLSDRSLVEFQTSPPGAVWGLNFERMLTLIAPTLVLVLVAALMVRVTLQPLRVLMRATHRVGADAPVPVPERGTGEIRALIQDFNAMQLRIHRLIASRTQALAAVTHDLRTPLARLQLRLEGAGVDDESRRTMQQDIGEMTDLLHSLQIYLGSEGAVVPPEPFDLAVMASTLIDSACDMGNDASYCGPNSLEMRGRVVALRRTLGNLIDNALHYGGGVRLTLLAEEDAIIVHVDDDGPGIPADRIEEVMQPFVRLDDARGRNTRGMGLGLAIVRDAIRAERGTLSLDNRPEGGLRATIRLPRTANAPAKGNIRLQS